MRSTRLLLLLILIGLLAGRALPGEVSVTPFPPDGAAVLVVADGWAYIVRGTPPVPVASWQTVGERPPNDPPGNPPDDLAVYVADLAAGLGLTEDRQKVADVFAAAVPEIKAGRLRGSKAIVEAVSKPIAAMNSAKWAAFSTMLFQHLLNDRRLVTGEQWAAAYESVATGLRGKEPSK